jgi:putative peptide zinc metalloprotease protein
MSTQPAADAWAALAPRRPRLRDDVRVHRHRYRGQPWYLLEDPFTGRFQRIDRSAWRILRLLDGERSVAGAVAGLAGDEAPPTHADVDELLRALDAAELLHWPEQPDAAALAQRQARSRRARALARLRSPFSLRLRLLDPDEGLDGLRPLARLVFGPLGLALWLALMALGAGALAAFWPDFLGYWDARGFTARSLLVMSLVYVLVKAVHELAHALAAKRWGAGVHEMGIMLLLLMPVPYVDVSATWAFPQKTRRMLVGAAGILAELLLAACAALVFVCVEDGLIRDLAYATVLVGSISTLAFNGNPLLRFDAYYVLADAVEIPNLATRASRYWGYLARRYLFGLEGGRSPVSAPGERAWFLGYGAASWLYRTAVVLGIALLVASEVPVLGLALALWALLGQVGVPLLRALVVTVRSAALAGRRVRATAVFLGLGAGVLVAAAVPLPHATSAQGVVWLPEQASLRAGTEGQVAELLGRPGEIVDPDTPVARLHNPLLDARERSLQWELAALLARQYAARRRDRVQAQVLAGDIDILEKELQAIRRERASLLVTSTSAGTLVIPRHRDLEGRFLGKGDIVAHVLPPGPPRIRVAVPGTDIGPLREGITGATVRLAQRPGEPVAASVTREVPQSTHELPSAALGALGGGDIPVLPGDAQGHTAAQSVFLLDLTLPAGTAPALPGGRAHVRFQHAAIPLGTRLARSVRQLFLSRLGV